MAKKKIPTQWRKITKEEKAKIISAYNNGKVRNEIMRQHKVAAGQFYSIIKDACIMINKVK